MKADGTGRKADAEASRVITYDIVLSPKDSGVYRVSERDGVGLDEYKTAIPGAKYDFEILEPGVRFVTYLEQDILAEGDLDIGGYILKVWNSEGISFGFKTTRGLGRTKLQAAWTAEFDLEKDVEKWLDFDIYGESPEWKRMGLEDAGAASDQISIEMKLKQKSGLSIRRYTTAVSSEDATEPDYEQVYVVRNVNGKQEKCPVIPGTSWSGAFRHHMESIKKGCADPVFGKTDKKQRSLIVFGESELSGAKEKLITRNAIDRFTNATVGHALYTERACFYGDTHLSIRVSRKVSEEFLRVLCMAILDLHQGMLSLGGLTAVGRGLFEIKELYVNGKQVPLGDNMGTAYDGLCKAVGGGR
ncbi:MAG TPA: hypothetical protein DF613_17220 [Lachnospiraceae bacterium]|nr:hypothetical protein [Lachnospiraceae bacterium]